MSKTFIRGLALLETIDLHGTMTVSELARRTGIDKSVVSRTLSACESDGWVVRAEGRVALGPRAALLAHTSPTATLVRQAEPLVEAISGVTGFVAQVYALVGRHGVVIASAGATWFETPAGLGTSVPLFATAAGKLIAAQLEPSELDALLPSEPFPDPAREMLARPVFAELASRLARRSRETPGGSAGVARTRRELDEQLDAVRRDGVARDHGELLPEMGCLAMPWPRPSLTAAIACMGPPVELAAREPLVEAVLRAAAVPGAARADVVAAASGMTARG